jgi:hypothetical protein
MYAESSRSAGGTVVAACHDLRHYITGTYNEQATAKQAWFMMRSIAHQIAKLFVVCHWFAWHPVHLQLPLLSCMCRLPAVMALGYISAFSETLALAVIAEKGLEPLCAAVAEEKEDHLCAAAAWSVGQIGRHTPDHAKAVADTGALMLDCLHFFALCQAVLSNLTLDMDMALS